MSLPSFSCNLIECTQILAGITQVLIHLCVFRADFWIWALVGESGIDPGYGVWDRKLVIQSSKGVRKKKC